MDTKKLKEILKKSFGKEKDTRLHAIVMLCIYAIFMAVLVIVIRVGGSNTNLENNDNTSTDTNINNEIKEELDQNSEENSDINYTYSYLIEYDGIKENYIGSRINNKQKFTYMKDNNTFEYAIIGNNYLILKDGIYHITDKLDSYFKYCDAEKILEIVDTYHNEGSEEENKYNVNTMDIASKFNDSLTNYCGANTNLISLKIENDNLKEVNMNLDNYISCIEGNNHSLNIKMEFASIGTTEDFEIKMN